MGNVKGKKFEFHKLNQFICNERLVLFVHWFGGACCIFGAKYLNNDFLVPILCVPRNMPCRTRKKYSKGVFFGRGGVTKMLPNSRSTTITLPPLMSIAIFEKVSISLWILYVEILRLRRHWLVGL